MEDDFSAKTNTKENKENKMEIKRSEIYKGQTFGAWLKSSEGNGFRCFQTNYTCIYRHINKNTCLI